MSLQGIELLTAAQAMAFRRPLKSSERVEVLFNQFRKEVPYIAQDEYMQPLMQKSVQFVQQLNIHHGA